MVASEFRFHEANEREKEVKQKKSNEKQHHEHLLFNLFFTS
jgi:hypothetical protein